MTKDQLIKEIMSMAGVTQAEAGKMLKAVEVSITDQLRNGEKVTLPGVGIFSVKERKERMGRNPATGESIKIPAAKSVGFKPVKSIRDSLNS